MVELLYDVDFRTISYYRKNVFADHEQEEESVIQLFFWMTAAGVKSYETQRYNLSAIIAIGYKVDSERAVQVYK